MDGIKDWQIVAESRTGSARIQNHVQAWARDSLTGEPVYILQLGMGRKGKKSRCECQSCDLPLLAVNAGKTEYILRPHFRHPNGAEKTECLFLAARLAALELLRAHGVFELPARRILGKVKGLSETMHEAWVEYPAERIKIRNFDFRDKAAAVITLDDGRQLRFHLIGSGSLSEEGQIIPSVYLDLKDTALAGMSPEELRQRTTLVLEGLCWRSHWKDIELQAQANDVALAKAVDLIDIEGEYLSELEGVEHKFRRETLLHLEVKRILYEAKQIRVPEIKCSVSREAGDYYAFEKSFDFPSRMLHLIDVAMERRFGNLIPDISAKTIPEDGNILLIEVTVTNTISAERQARILQNNTPTIEIDLSRLGGLISRVQLRELVIEGLEFKRWLCHPEASLCQHELETWADMALNEWLATTRAKEAEAQSALRRAIEEKAKAHELILSTPIEKIAAAYLSAIRKHARSERNRSTENYEERSRLLKEVPIHAEKLQIHGFGAAMDKDLYGDTSAIIPRILSIKNGGGVGYDLDSTMGVMNAIKQVNPESRKYHTLYLIAESVYRNPNASPNPTWYQNWVKEIRRSIQAGEKMYARTRRYDGLLSLLFPEMKARLDAPFGTENYDPRRKKDQFFQTQQKPAQNISAVPFKLSKGVSNSENLWLEGVDFDQWKRNHPDAAREFLARKQLARLEQ